MSPTPLDPTALREEAGDHDYAAGRMFALADADEASANIRRDAGHRHRTTATELRQQAMDAERAAAAGIILAAPADEGGGTGLTDNEATAEDLAAMARNARRHRRGGGERRGRVDRHARAHERPVHGAQDAPQTHERA